MTSNINTIKSLLNRVSPGILNHRYEWKKSKIWATRWIRAPFIHAFTWRRRKSIPWSQLGNVCYFKCRKRELRRSSSYAFICQCTTHVVVIWTVRYLAEKRAVCIFFFILFFSQLLFWLLTPFSLNGSATKRVLKRWMSSAVASGAKGSHIFVGFFSVSLFSKMFLLLTLWPSNFLDFSPFFPAECSSQIRHLYVYILSAMIREEYRL